VEVVESDDELDDHPARPTKTSLSSAVTVDWSAEIVLLARRHSELAVNLRDGRFKFESVVSHSKS